MRRCGVLGDPVAHSLSPALHRAGYEACGLAWEYDAHRVPAGGLAAFVAGLDDSWRGLSLTMPLKREALELCDSLTPVARLAGGVNTLLLTDGEVHGDNTDVAGAGTALREAGVSRVAEATVVGGGATATSVGLALLDLGASRLRLLVRSADRAAATLGLLAGHPRATRIEVCRLGEPVVGEVLASTVPPAAQDDGLVARAAAAETLFEVLYDPWPTPLAAAATARGQRVVSGLDLLVAQAALQFTAFTGLTAPVEAMRAAGQRALAQRALAQRGRAERA
jgi:shikimate dehydrogenase